MRVNFADTPVKIQVKEVKACLEQGAQELTVASFEDIMHSALHYSGIHDNSADHSNGSQRQVPRRFDHCSNLQKHPGSSVSEITRTATECLSECNVTSEVTNATVTSAIFDHEVLTSYLQKNPRSEHDNFNIPLQSVKRVPFR